LLQPVFAQTFKSNAIAVVVAGTSTLHDWEMKAGNGSIAAHFEIDAAGKLTDLLSLNFVVGPTALKSGKDAMDNNAYKAMDTKTYNVIKFAATSGTITPQGSGYIVKCVGLLQIAGKAINTEVTATCTVGADGSISFNGKKAIKMTTFGVKPPTFMMGSIKTGDDITISFSGLMRK
jgi:polyisoprenoid-binding protein YceI